MDKFKKKEKEFKEIFEEVFNLFSKKNRHYGNDYFDGDYTELERWMSVRRKIARLKAYYSGDTKNSLPDETLVDTWKDLAAYCIMELIILKGGDSNGEKN